MAAGGNNLGSAQFTITADYTLLAQALSQVLTTTQATMLQVQVAFRSGFQAGAQAATQNLQQVNTQLQKTNQQATVLGLNLQKVFSFTAIATGAGIFGVAGAVHKVVSTIIDDTKEAQQAQFALNKIYGDGASDMTKFAKELGASIGKSTAEMQKAVVVTQSLSKNYGISNEQIKELTRRSADLAAIKGGDVFEATKRVEAAIRGEAESSEILGLTLNSTAVKALANMTEEQRKNYETLDQATKAQINYNEFIRQTDQALGAASERAETNIGKINKLQAAYADWAAETGSGALPLMGSLAEQLTKFVKYLSDTNAAAENTAVRFQLFNKALHDTNSVTGQSLKVMDTFKAGLTALIDPALIGFFQNLQKAIMALAAPWTLSVELTRSLSSALDALHFGGTDKDVERQKEINKGMREAGMQTERTRLEQAEIDSEAEQRRKRAKEQIEEEKDIRVDQAKASKKYIEGQIEEENKIFEVRKINLEVELDNALKAHEEKTKIVEKDLRSRRQAIEASFDQEIKQAQHDRDVAKQASADKRDAALNAIKEEEEATKEKFANNIKLLQVERDETLKALADKKDAAIESIKAEKEEFLKSLDLKTREARREKDETLKAIADKKKAALDAIKDEEDAELDSIKERLALAEQAKDKAQRSAQDAHDNRIANIEKEKAKSKDLYDRLIEQAEIERDKKKQASEDKKEAALDALEEEYNAIRDKREAEDKALKDQYEAESKLNESKHKTFIDSLEKEKDAILENKDATLESIEAEIEGVKDQGEQKLKDLDKQKDYIDKLHNEYLKYIDKESDALKEQHETVLAQLDAEKTSRLAINDDAINAIKRQQDADKRSKEDKQLSGTLSTARGKLLDLETNGGSIQEIVAARKAVADAEQAIIDKQREREQNDSIQALEEERSLIEDAYKAKKDAADAETKAKQDALKTQKEAEEEAYKAKIALIKDEVDKTREATADTLKGIEDRKKAYLDYVDQVLKNVEDKKKAENDAYNAIKDAAKDRYDFEQDKLKEFREKEDKALEEKRKKIQETYESEQKQIKATYDDPETGIITRLKNTADEADKSFSRRKDAADEAYKHEQRKIHDVYDDPVNGILSKLKKQADEAKDKYNARKEDVAKAYEDEREQVAKTYDDPVDGVFAKLKDQADEAKTQYDRRTTEVTKAYDAEKEAVKELYDHPINGLIQRQKDMATEAEKAYKARTEAIKIEYEKEQAFIKATYDDELTGLIPKLQTAKSATLSAFEEMARDVKTEMDKQKEEIKSTYRNPAKTGKLDLLEQAHEDTVNNLKDEKEKWDDWADAIKKAAGRAKGDLDEFIKSLKELDKLSGIKITGGIEERPGGGAAVGNNIGGNAAYSPVVKNASPNSFWTSNGSHGGHPAADIFAEKGTPIYAPVGGNLSSFRDNKGGNAAILDGADGKSYYFAHGNVPFSSGNVKRGESIGQVGNTGNAEGLDPHLHFAISSKGSSLFAQLGGSGDISGDASYWGDGGPGDAIEDGDDLVIRLLNRIIRIKKENPTGMDLVKSIERLGTAIGGKDFGRAAATIAHNEGAATNLNAPGLGGARGPFQFDPGGELPNYARYLKTDVETAGNFAAKNPLHAAKWALEGYLGRAIKEGINQGLRGFDLALYGSREGQRPQEVYNGVPLEDRIRNSWNYLYGFANGGVISRESILVDKHGPYGKIAEGNRPEVIVGANDTQKIFNRGMYLGPYDLGFGGSSTSVARPSISENSSISGGVVERQRITVMVGKSVLADWYVQGRQLAIIEGRDDFRNTSKG